MEGISKNDGFDGPDGAAIDSDGYVIGEDGPGDGPSVKVVTDEAGPDEDHHQTIAENLAEDRRRQAEEAERTATPPPKKEADPPPAGEGSRIGRASPRCYYGRRRETVSAVLYRLQRCGSGCPRRVISYRRRG